MSGGDKKYHSGVPSGKYKEWGRVFFEDVLLKEMTLEIKGGIKTDIDLKGRNSLSV